MDRIKNRVVSQIVEPEQENGANLTPYVRPGVQNHDDPLHRRSAGVRTRHLADAAQPFCKKKQGRDYQKEERVLQVSLAFFLMADLG